MRINAIYRTVSSRGFAVAVFFTTILSVLASVSLPTVRADVEPNDDFATAEAVTPGTHTGALDSVDVNDYYKTTLTASGQTVYVNVTVPGSLTMDLNLYDGGQQEVDNDIGVVGGIARVDFTFEVGQTVYVRLHRAAGTGSYSMELAIMSQNDANSGGDAGNDFTTATSVTPGTYPSCFLKDQDGKDYYKLVLPAAGQTVYVNVTVPGTLTISLSLYDGAQQEVDNDIGVVGAVARVDFTYETAQDVYIYVKLANGQGLYDVEIDLLSQNDANSGGDAGNDFTTATSVTSGTYPSCFLKDQDGKDYYQAILAVSGTVYVNVTVPGTLTINLFLYDQSHQEVDNDIGVVGAVGRVSYAFTAAQTVFAKVAIASGQGLYTLEAFVPGEDNTPPTITHTPVTTASVGVVIPITADVTDNVAVDKVYLNYTNVTGVNFNASMTKNGNTYSYDIPVQSSVGSVAYFIWANDTNGNEKRTQAYTITVSADTTPPTIVHTPVTSANVGDTITITATITDNQAVQSATLYYKKTSDASFTSTTMTKSGNTYTATIPSAAVTTAGVKYYISATDGVNTATSPATNPTTSPHSITVTEKAKEAEFPWLWVIIIIIVIIIVILLAMMMTRKKPKTEPPEEGASPPQENQ